LYAEESLRWEAFEARADVSCGNSSRKGRRCFCFWKSPLF